jgi:thioredoxin 1
MSATSTLVALTESSFDKSVIASELPVIVDFWAEWCSPCHAVTPELESLAEDLAGQVAVMSVDIDANPALARRFDVMSLPTVMLFRNGEPTARSVGAKPKAALRSDLGL